MSFDPGDQQSPGRQVQLLLCMNLQKEHLAPGRRHLMVGTDDVLTACAAIMEGWRARRWPVVHLKRIARAVWFNPASAMTDWIDEFGPHPAEIVFEHPLPSAYSSSRFAAYMAEIGRSTPIVMIGFSLDQSVLATVVDGFHRGHNIRVAADAVASSQPECCDVNVYREVLLGVVRDYATLEPIDTALDPEGQVGR
ncbi:MAG TPA: isochorismatase family protein [Pseudolabrys sp.]|jgi:nicotinamidase-related amidase